MGNYHPDVKLRVHHAFIYFVYDGSVHINIHGQSIGVDGLPIREEAHTHRLAPNEWHTTYLADAVNDAIMAHHDKLGINRPAPGEIHPLHLHPQGHPSMLAKHPIPERTERQVPASFTDDLRAHIVSAKEAELGHSIPPDLHPLKEQS